MISQKFLGGFHHLLLQFLLYLNIKQHVKLAEENENIVAITASMKDGTGLKEFSEKFKNRFFDVGIAEGHAICMAGGMATNNIIPVVPIYSSFY